MKCRPSEVREESESDIALWTLWDNVESLLAGGREPDSVKEVVDAELWDQLVRSGAYPEGGGRSTSLP